MSTRLIKVSEQSYKRLLSQGRMGDTFDDVVSRLLDECEKKKGDSQQLEMAGNAPRRPTTTQRVVAG